MADTWLIVVLNLLKDNNLDTCLERQVLRDHLDAYIAIPSKKSIEYIKIVK